MKKLIITSSVVLAGGLGLATAADKAEPQYRVSLSGAVGFNIRARFNAAGSAGLAAAGSHVYDDGSVGPETGAATPGTTTTWTYNNRSQVVKADGVTTYDVTTPISAQPLTAGSLLNYNGNQNTGWGHDDARGAMEIKFSRRISSGEKWSWWLNGAFGWADLSFRDNQALVVDTYSINPPPLGTPISVRDAGEVGGIASVDAIPVSPNPTATYPASRRQQVNAAMDGSMYAFRLGPEIDLALSSKCSLALNAGLSVAVIDSSYHFGGAVTASGIPNSSATKALVGGHVGMSLNYMFNDRWSGTLGLLYQNVGTFRHGVNNNETSEIDLSQSLLLSFGVRYSF